MSLLDQKKLLARRFIEEVINQRKMSTVDELVSDKASDEAQESLTMYLVLNAFPDFRVNIERIVAEGNKVTVLSTFGGTHRREFMGIPPTGRGVRGRKIDIFTIEDGKITNILYNFDLINLMNQIGVFPAQAVYTPEQATRH